jgi:hypothetical protein
MEELLVARFSEDVWLLFSGWSSSIFAGRTGPGRAVCWLFFSSCLYIYYHPFVTLQGTLDHPNQCATVLHSCLVSKSCEG